MTIETTTTGTAPATITERELFAHFAYSDVIHLASYGSTILDYTPSDYLREGGVVGELFDATNAMADELEVSDQPSEDLDNLVMGVEAHLHQLRIVQRDFEAYKKIFCAEPDHDEPDRSDPVAHAAWKAEWEEHDRAPRFRAPAELAG